MNSHGPIVVVDAAKIGYLPLVKFLIEKSEIHKGHTSNKGITHDEEVQSVQKGIHTDWKISFLL